MTDTSAAPEAAPRSTPAQLESNPWQAHAVSKLESRLDVLDCKLDNLIKSLDALKESQGKALPDLRDRAVRLEVKVDATCSTADLEAAKSNIRAETQRLITEQTWKYLGVVAGMATLAFLAARFIKV
tara:strand:- start:277 stop:657 length:381 start_codon:yes stop_codon:yes gene_type:complete